MKIVITGATQGLGHALAAEFLTMGDSVAFCSRSHEKVDRAMHEWAHQGFTGKIFGMACDVGNYADFAKFGAFAGEKLQYIDIWINNAGTNGFEHTPVQDSDPSIMEMVVRTNLLGSLYGTKIALQIMQKQGKGHIFNAEGLGSNGMASPGIAAYGATKSGIRHLLKTLISECKESAVGVHNFSPGMMMTDLLVKNFSSKNTKIFNILAETPETVAKFLTPRIRGIRGTGKRILYLTGPKIMGRFLTAGKRKNKFFDESGNRIIPAQ